MSLKTDKNGNIEGFIKKDHHEKIINNSNKKTNDLIDELDKLRESYINIEKNHNIFLQEYKKKCEEYNKIVLKLEGRKVKTELLNELNDYKSKYKTYFDKYGSL